MEKLNRLTPKRKTGSGPKRYDYPVDKIRQWIAQGKTQAWIGQQLGVDAKLIYKVCKKHAIQCQRTGPRSGPGHPDWKGGRHVDRNGYVHVYRPGHPRAHKPRCTHVLEHILVMEDVLGRPLEPGEVVHHKQARDNNDPDNLVLYQCNADHLRDELAGKCPNWTEDGKQRIQDGIDLSAANRRGIARDEWTNKRAVARLQT